MQVFPMTGSYGNDCPFCHTHNAILEEYDATAEGGFKHQCRDCKREFKADNQNNTWTPKEVK